MMLIYVPMCCAVCIEYFAKRISGHSELHVEDEDVGVRGATCKITNADIVSRIVYAVVFKSS